MPMFQVCSIVAITLHVIEIHRLLCLVISRCPSAWFGWRPCRAQAPVGTGSEEPLGGQVVAYSLGGIKEGINQKGTENSSSVCC